MFGHDFARAFLPFEFGQFFVALPFGSKRVAFAVEQAAFVPVRHGDTLGEADVHRVGQAAAHFGFGNPRQFDERGLRAVQIGSEYVAAYILLRHLLQLSRVGVAQPPVNVDLFHRKIGRAVEPHGGRRNQQQGDGGIQPA